MSFETIVRQDSPGVRMVPEINPVHVPSLALPPVGGIEHPGRRWYRATSIGPELDSDALVMGETEKIVDDIEALFALRMVNAADIHQLLELTVHIVAEKCQNANDSLAMYVYDKFVAGKVDRNHGF
jgi:hypothetical protein